MNPKNNKTVEIDGIEYVPKSSVPAAAYKNTKYVIVRTYSAGVFAGYLKSRKGQEAEVMNARRLWYWDGAASLSQLAQSGTTKPDKCKFPEAVNRIVLTQVIEILDVTPEAQKIIESVPVWKA